MFCENVYIFMVNITDIIVRFCCFQRFFKPSKDPTLFHPGDLIFLKAHTGCYLEVQEEGSPVQARWEDLGVWQGLELAKKDTDPLRVGDILFLKSHTGLYVDVQGDGVQARWADEGDWQALTISR